MPIFLSVKHDKHSNIVEFSLFLSIPFSVFNDLVMCSSPQVYLPNPSATDDLASMSEMTENMILQELMLRYSKDVIYVSAIPIDTVKEIADATICLSIMEC